MVVVEKGALSVVVAVVVVEIVSGVVEPVRDETSNGAGASKTGGVFSLRLRV